MVSPIPDHAFFEQPLFVLSHLAHHFAPSNGDGARLNGTNARRVRNLQDDKILLDHPQFVQSPAFGELWGRLLIQRRRFISFQSAVIICSRVNMADPG